MKEPGFIPGLIPEKDEEGTVPLRIWHTYRFCDYLYVVHFDTYQQIVVLYKCKTSESFQDLLLGGINWEQVSAEEFIDHSPEEAKDWLLFNLDLFCGGNENESD